MKLVKILLIVLTFLLLYGLAHAEGISVSQTLSESTIPFESNSAFEIKLQWDGPQWAYRFDKPLSPTFDRLKVKGFTSSISSQGTGADEISIKTYHYTLFPTSSGRGTIDPVNISFVAMPDSIPGELVTESMMIQINDPVVIEETNWTNIVLIVSAIALVVVVIFVLLVIRLKKKNKGDVVKSPKDKAIEELDILKSTAGNDMKKFQTGLYQLFKEFVIEKYSINPESMEDDELIKNIMECGLSKADGERLSGWIIKAKQDKFRPVIAAPGDTIRLETEVREFFSKL